MLRVLQMENTQPRAAQRAPHGRTSGANKLPLQFIIAVIGRSRTDVEGSPVYMHVYMETRRQG